MKDQRAELTPRLRRQRAPGQWRIHAAVLQPGRLLAVTVETSAGCGVTERVMNRSEHVVLGITEVRMRVAAARRGKDPELPVGQVVRKGNGIGVRVDVLNLHVHAEPAALRATHKKLVLLKGL